MSDQPTPDQPQTVSLTIDGKAVEADPGTLIIRAAEQAGIQIPRFCDHPLLDPVGACRQCVVEVEGQRKPVMSCTMPVADDMVVTTHHTSEVAAKAQESALEFLLINHPLDCPMCDKGGECPLQDQALAHGNNESRFVEAKRRYDKPAPVSSLVLLDRERCVLCARCTRFSEQISGDPFIELFERGALEQVAVFEDEPYESVFQGNTIQICPVGALTSTDYRFKARPFDVRSAATACTHCASGCAMTTQARSGEVTRNLARTNMAVNEMWLCDRGRFGFEHLRSDRRVLNPTIDGEVASWATALSATVDAIEAAAAGGTDKVGVIHGGRLANEDVSLLAQFTRQVLDTDRIHLGPQPLFDDAEALAAHVGSDGATNTDLDTADVIVVAGLDPRDEAGVLFLRLRKAWRDSKAKIVAVGPRPGSLGELVWRVLPTMPEGEADALAALGGSNGNGAGAYDHPHVSDIAAALDNATNPVILVGERAGTNALRAAHAVAAKAHAKVGFVPSRGNVRGAIEAGAISGMLPGGRLMTDGNDLQAVRWEWDQAIGDERRHTLDSTLEAAAAGDVSVLLVFGADLLAHHPNRELVARALDCATVVAVDTMQSSTVAAANVVLPAAANEERSGTTTTWAGEQMRTSPAVAVTGQALPDWQILVGLAGLLGADLRVDDLAGVRAAIERLERRATAHPMPAFEPATVAASNGLQLVTHRQMGGDAQMMAGAEHVQAAVAQPTVELHPVTAGELGINDGDTVTLTQSGAAGDVQLTRPAHVHRMIRPGIVFTSTVAGGNGPVPGPVELAVADVREPAHV